MRQTNFVRVGKPGQTIGWSS